MRKLKTDILGGFPFTLNDLRWMDEGIRDAIKGMFSHLGLSASESFRISGAVVSIVNNVYSWTDGYICLAGEILKVVSGSVTTTGQWIVGQTVYWQIDISYDIEGLKMFENPAISHDTYEIRNAKLVFGIPAVNMQGQSDYMPHDASYIKQKWLALISSTDLLDVINSSDLLAKLRDIEEGLRPVSFEVGCSNYGNGHSPVGYKKDLFGVLHICGAAVVPSNYVGVIFTLPILYRPSFRTVINNQFTINTNGDVSSSDINSIIIFFNFSFKL